MRELERKRREANREWLRNRQREVGFQQSLAYKFLRQQGVTLDHLPTRGSRLWFSYKLLREPELYLTTNHHRQEHNK